MLISESYRHLNAAKHEEDDRFGTQGSKHIGVVSMLIERYGITSILDYGCGKAELKSTMPEHMQGMIRCYDPCIAQHSARPEKADLLVSTDVMEHIEPECLDDVLADISSLAERYAYLNISLVEARKTLADGRNAHLIVRPGEWWVDKLRGFFTLIEGEKNPIELNILCRRKGLKLC